MSWTLDLIEVDDESNEVTLKKEAASYSETW